MHKTISDILLHGNNAADPPVTANLPFPYHFIPGVIRSALAKILFRKHIRSSGYAPHGRTPYLDDSVDQMVSRAFPNQAATWRWPGGKRCALVFSHDVDSPGMERGIGRLARLSEARGFSASFSFVGEHIARYGETIRRLIEPGHDIALHDHCHDNRIAFLPRDEVLTRLEKSRQAVTDYHIKGFRSPSWYTSQNLWDALEAFGFDYDMSVLDSYPFFERGRCYGVGTFFPYQYKNLVILPNTIPFELPWYGGVDKGDTLAFWKPKLDRIALSGGLIMINAHPDTWLCGNQKAVETVEETLDYVLETHDPVALNARQLAEHARAQLAVGAARVGEGILAPLHGKRDAPPPTHQGFPLVTS